MVDVTLSKESLTFLKEAVSYMESPSLFMQFANKIGQPIEYLINLPPIPDNIKNGIHDLAKSALLTGMNFASNTIWQSPTNLANFEQTISSSNWTGFWHSLATSVSGGVSGIFGFSSIAVELPITTTIIFRSITAISQEFGNDISNPANQMECLSIFMHGGKSSKDDSMESAFLSSRLAIKSIIQETSKFVAEQSTKSFSEALAKGTAPFLVNYLNMIAQQFGASVSQKFLAQSIPIISITTGAAINAAFTDHFNKVAKYHFGLKKLEKEYGLQYINDEYIKQKQLAN